MKGISEEGSEILGVLDMDVVIEEPSRVGLGTNDTTMKLSDCSGLASLDDDPDSSNPPSLVGAAPDVEVGWSSGDDDVGIDFEVMLSDGLVNELVELAASVGGTSAVVEVVVVTPVLTRPNCHGHFTRASGCGHPESRRTQTGRFLLKLVRQVGGG